MALRWRAWQGCPPRSSRPGPGDFGRAGVPAGRPQEDGSPGGQQVSLTALGEEEVLTTLRNTPVETLTPLQALNLLHELKEKL